MNKDGAMDLVVSSDPNQDVAVLSGNGDELSNRPSLRPSRATLVPSWSQILTEMEKTMSL